MDCSLYKGTPCGHKSCAECNIYGDMNGLLIYNTLDRYGMANPSEVCCPRCMLLIEVDFTKTHEQHQGDCENCDRRKDNDL